MVEEADRYELKNSNSPNSSTLPRADRDAMEEFIINLKMIIGTLGHRLLDPIVNSMPSADDILVSEKEDQDLLYFEVGGLISKGQQSDEGFVILSGAELTLETSLSIPGKMLELRNRLLKDKNLIPQKNKLVLDRNIVVSSSSYAAGLIAGSSRSGPQSWKNTKGQTLKEIEEKELKEK